MRYDRPSHCTGQCQPGCVRLQSHLLRAYPGTANYGCYNCRQIRGGGPLSLHAEGRAIDMGIPRTLKHIGDEIFALAIFNAEALGIQEVIWYRQVWSAEKEYVHYYGGSVPHTDHVHIGLNWDGALARTSWFRNEPAIKTKPPAPRFNMADATDVYTHPKKGYYILQADGGVFAYGGAPYYGSVPGARVTLNENSRAIALIATKSGKGYWIIGRDGGVFAFGDARFYGSYTTLAPGLKKSGIYFVGAVRTAPGGYAIIANDKSLRVFNPAGT